MARARPRSASGHPLVTAAATVRHGAVWSITVSSCPGAARVVVLLSDGRTYVATVSAHGSAAFRLTMPVAGKLRARVKVDASELAVASTVTVTELRLRRRASGPRVELTASEIVDAARRECTAAHAAPLSNPTAPHRATRRSRRDGRRVAHSMLRPAPRSTRSTRYPLAARRSDTGAPKSSTAASGPIVPRAIE